MPTPQSSDYVEVQGGARKPVCGIGKCFWQLAPFERGRSFDRGLGNSLGANFPVVDRFDNGVVTSIKSLDLGAKSYLTPGAVLGRVTGYVDEVQNFQGVEWRDNAIQQSEIMGRVLDLVVPSVGTRAQESELSDAADYAKSVGVNMNVYRVH
jgi:filamentous hemagglutinin